MVSCIRILMLCLASVGFVQSSRVLNPFGNQLFPSSPVKLCTVFGFKSRSGQYLYDAIFGDNTVPKDVMVFRAKSTRELVEVAGSGDVALAHLSLLERNTGAETLLENISSHVQGLCKRSHPSSLLILVEGRESEGADLEREVSDIVAEVESFGCSLEVIFRYSGTSGAFDVEQVEAIRDTLLSRAIESANRRKKHRTVMQVDTILRRVREPVFKGSPNRRVNAAVIEKQQREYAATEACKDLPQDYNDRLNSSLIALMNKADSTFISTNATMRALASAVKRVASEFQATHQKVFEAHRSSDVVRLQLPARCRDVAANLLHPLYYEVVQHTLRDATNKFDLSTERVPEAANNPQEILRQLAQNTFEAFGRKLDHIRRLFVKMVQSSVVFDDDLSTPGTVSPLALPQFDATFEKHQLTMHMIQRTDERMRALCLAGAFNPYTRSYPFPPVLLNFNYLVDPKGIFANRDFKRLYDEPKLGPCENRADPLLFEGVAMIPFDPNDIPLRPDPRTTFQRVKDLISGKDKWSIE